MPELPDLQIFSGNLNRMLKGKKVSNVKLNLSPNANVSASVLKNTLVGQTLKKAYREGKELHFQFSKDDVLGLHLMFHGAMTFTEMDDVVKHAVLEVVFADDKKLVLTDWQRAAKIKLNPEESDVPDALSKHVTGKSAIRVLFEKTQHPIFY